MNNFKEFGDEGDIWYGEQVTNMIKEWYKWFVIISSIRIVEEGYISPKDEVLDIGCGNAVILNNLAEEGFCNLCGMDYVEKAVELAKEISQANGHTIKFYQDDILNLREKEKKYQLVIDKGTLDAILLTPNVSRTDLLVPYLESLSYLIQPDGYFIITSCNMTLDQIKKCFPEEYHFIDTIDYPTYSFGGSQGSTASTAIYKYKPKS